MRVWRIWCVVAVVVTLGVGFQHSQSIQRFRDPATVATVAIGQPQLVDGATYELASFTHAPALPGRPGPGDDSPDPLVDAMTGAELVQVVLTVERIELARDPATMFCTVTVADDAGRSWTADLSVGYEVAGPEAVTCTGGLDEPARVGEPFDVAFVFQVPADAADRLVVKARLTGGVGTHLVEFRPR